MVTLRLHRGYIGDIGGYIRVTLGLQGLHWDYIGVRLMLHSGLHNVS